MQKQITSRARHRSRAHAFKIHEIRSRLIWYSPWNEMGADPAVPLADADHSDHAGQQRALDDAQRGVAEEQRAVAEEQRAVAEDQRGVAEDQRAVAEEQRGVAEDQRAVAEEQRAVAEDSRLTDERLRQ